MEVMVVRVDGGILEDLNTKVIIIKTMEVLLQEVNMDVMVWVFMVITAIINLH